MKPRRPSGCAALSAFFLVGLLLSFPASATSLLNGPGKISGPRLIFEERIYDFGVSGPGSTITHVFTFVNAGSQPVSIENVKTNCGCTAALVSETDIPRGGNGQIRASFETKRYEGKQETTITVLSNDPEEPEIALTIKGIIKREVAVVPQGLHFGDVKKGTSSTRAVRVLQLSGDRLVVNRVEANEDYLAVSTSRFSEENSRGVQVDITLKPDAPVGELSEIITLHTNLKRRPRIDVPVWANILGRIRVEPRALSFGSIPKGKPIPQILVVSSHDGEPFRITKTTCNLPFVHLTSTVDEKSMVVKVSGTVDEVSPAGRVAGRIDIYTDDPDQQVIHVPVYGAIQKTD